MRTQESDESALDSTSASDLDSSRPVVEESVKDARPVPPKRGRRSKSSASSGKAASKRKRTSKRKQSSRKRKVNTSSDNDLPKLVDSSDSVGHIDSSGDSNDLPADFDSPSGESVESGGPSAADTDQSVSGASASNSLEGHEELLVRGGLVRELDVRSDRGERPAPSSADDPVRREPVVPGTLVGVPSEEIKKQFVMFHIQPENLMRWWPLVLEGVREVIKRTHPTFSENDVYQILRDNRAWLLPAFEKESKKYSGFVIISQEPADQFTGHRDMLLWMAHSKVPGAVKALMPHLEAIGKQLGFKSVVMHSPRKGWLRLAEQLGFTLRERVFVKAL
jgi:hypothetical protein